MANDSLGDAFVRIGVDLGSLSGDLSAANQQVKAAFREIVNSINGIKFTPQLIDRDAADRAFVLFQKIFNQLQQGGLNAHQAGLEMEKLSKGFEVAAVSAKQLGEIESQAAKNRKLFGQEQLQQQEAAFIAEQKLQEAIKRTTQIEQDKRVAADNTARTTGAKVAFGDIEAQEAAYQRLIDAEGKLQQQNAKTQVSAQQMFSGIRTAGITLTAVITAPILEVIKDATEFGGRMERLQNTLTRLTGSSDVAKSSLKSLVSESLQSPFDLKVLVEGERRLISFGFSASTAARYLHILGDATAAVGGNSGTLSRLILAIGEIEQKGVLTGKEIRQLGNAPLGAVKIISEELGISTEKVLAGVKDKAITADNAIAVLMKGITDKFGGEQKRQSEDTLGQLHRLKTEYELTAAAIGDAINPVTKEVTKFFADSLEGGRSLAKVLAELPTPVKGILFAFTGVVGAVGPILGTVGQVGFAINGLKLGMEELGGATVVGGIAALTLGWAALAIAITGGAIALNAYAKEQLRLGSNFALPNDPNVGNGDPGFKPTPTAQNFAAQNLSKFGVGGVGANSDLLNLSKLPRVDPLAELRRALQGKGEGREFSRSDLFSNAGLTDVKTDYERTKIAVDSLWESLTRIEKTQASNQLEKRLRDMFKAGELSAEQFDAAVQRVEARLEKAGGAVNVAAPRLFIAPSTTETQRVKDQQEKHDYDALIKSTLEYEEALQALDRVKAGSRNLEDLAKADRFNVFGQREAELAQIDAEIVKYRQSDKGLQEISNTYEKLASAIGLVNGAQPNKFFEDINRTDKAFKLFGIDDARKSVSNLTAEYKFLLDERKNNVTFADGSEVVSVQNLEKAWYKLQQARLSNGEKLTAQEEANYFRIQRHISGVTRLQQAYRDLKGAVSNVFDGLIRDTVDLLIPAASSKAKTPLVPDNITGSFAEAFSSISAKGYSDPKKALIDITNAIKNAGSTAEANAIAVRNFGAQGPVIANLLRTGQLSVEQITYAIDKGADTLGKMAAKEAEVSKASTLLDNLWRNLAKGGLTIFAKAIEGLIVDQLKPLLSHLGEILKTVPIIGGVLGKIFGAGGSAAGKVASIGGKAAGIGIDTASGVGAEELGQLGGAAGAAGAGAAGAASSAAGAVASAGIQGLVQTVSGVVTAVASVASGIVSGLQNAHMISTLGHIEENTRRLDIATTQNGAECLFAFAKTTMQNTQFIHDRLVEIGNKLIDPVTVTLEGIEQAIKNLRAATGGTLATAAAGGGGGDTYNITIDASTTQSDPEVADAAQRLTTLLRQRGTRRGRAV